MSVAKTFREKGARSRGLPAGQEPHPRTAVEATGQGGPEHKQSLAIFTPFSLPTF